MTTKKTPDDQPFELNLDAVASENDLTPYRIHAHGRRWTLQHMDSLDVWGLIEGAQKGDFEAAMAILQAAFGEDWDDFRKNPLPRFKFGELYSKYTAHCGMTPGESQASTAS